MSTFKLFIFIIVNHSKLKEYVHFSFQPVRSKSDPSVRRTLSNAWHIFFIIIIIVLCNSAHPIDHFSPAFLFFRSINNISVFMNIFRETKTDQIFIKYPFRWDIQMKRSHFSVDLYFFSFFFFRRLRSLRCCLIANRTPHFYHTSLICMYINIWNRTGNNSFSWRSFLLHIRHLFHSRLFSVL